MCVFECVCVCANVCFHFPFIHTLLNSLCSSEASVVTFKDNKTEMELVIGHSKWGNLNLQDESLQGEIRVCVFV